MVWILTFPFIWNTSCRERERQRDRERDRETRQRQRVRQRERDRDRGGRRGQEIERQGASTCDPNVSISSEDHINAPGKAHIVLPDMLGAR
jgi:hypothetical protein